MLQKRSMNGVPRLKTVLVALVVFGQCWTTASGQTLPDVLYRFEEGTGADIVDSVSGALHGTLVDGAGFTESAPCLASGQENRYAANFSANGFARMDNHGFIFNHFFVGGAQGDASLEWLMMPYPVGHNSIFWSNGDNNADENRHNIFWNADFTGAPDSDRFISGDFIPFTGSGLIDTGNHRSNVPLELHVWNHVAIVREDIGVGQYEWSWYYNGVRNAGQTRTTQDDFPTSSEWLIAGRQGAAGARMLIDELRMVNRALQPGQFNLVGVSPAVVAASSDEKRLRRGDVNENRKIDVGDVMQMLFWQFVGIDRPNCPDSADIDNDGQLTLADSLRLLNYLFRAGEPPESPGPFVCRADDDFALGCDSYDPCDWIGCGRRYLVLRENPKENIIRRVYSDGTEEWDVPDRGSDRRFLDFLPNPWQPSPEPVPSGSDMARGYLTFATGSEGILSDVVPAQSDLGDQVSIFASLGETEAASFAIRPLQDLGEVVFTSGDFTGPNSATIPASNVTLYIVESVVDQTDLNNDVARWFAKWLRPGNTADASVERANVQVFVDVQVPGDAEAGLYSGAVTISPERGGESSFTVELEVLDLSLTRPMPWGLYEYNWSNVQSNPTGNLRVLQEMKRIGMTQCVISPIHFESAPRVFANGTLDMGLYDACVDVYKQAGFEDGPILAMEGLMHNIAASIGMASALGFTNNYSPGVSFNDIPTAMWDQARIVLQNLYDHAIAADWPSDYQVYFADEPSPGSPKMVVAQFMYGVWNEILPDSHNAASTVYLTSWWEDLTGLLDLNIAHWVHPCGSPSSNFVWQSFANNENSELYAIEWITNRDTFWEPRSIGLPAEKCHLDGVMLWVQFMNFSISGNMGGSFDAYDFLGRTWKGGPWFLTHGANPIWVSTPWLGLREAIDDSRYLRTLEAAIETANAAGATTAAQDAEDALQDIMNGVPDSGDALDPMAEWNTANGPDAARRALAEAAIQCLSSIP